MIANLNNLLSLNRVSQVPNSRSCKNFTSCLLNARSVCNKTLVIKDFVVDHVVDLLGITETWLHLKGDDVTIGSYWRALPEWLPFCSLSGPAGTGGGVGLLYKRGFCTKTRMCQHSFRSFECMDVTFINRKSIRALVEYRPPETGTVIDLFFEEFSSLLEEVVVCSEELLIIGDFNFHMDDTADRYAAQFGSLLELLNLKQHVAVPTHRSGHILDLVISRKDAEALKVNELVVMEQLISDHKANCFQLNLQKPLNERKSVVSRRLRNFDFEAFYKIIISSGLRADVSDLSLELMVDRYDNVLRDTMDILAPVKSRTIVLRPNVPWYNEDIGNGKRKRRRLERRWRSSRLESDRLSYIEQCSVVNTMLYKAKEFYYSSVIRDNAHDTRLLF